MNKFQLTLQQRTVGSIIRKVVASRSRAVLTLGACCQSSIDGEDICDVILPGMDPIPLDV